MGLMLSALPACRPEGWELRLAAVIEAARLRPFAWGEFDCATFASEVVEAVAGRSIDMTWRGRYSTKYGARRYLARQGYQSFADAVSARLGPPLSSPELAQRGDIVLLGDDALGVCTGLAALFLMAGCAGLEAVVLAACSAAWRL
jgi:hypothetical protein